MKTPKCPICGTVLQFFHELKFGGLGRVGCSSCEWVTFLASPPQAWKAAEEFISKFPPIMKVCPGDKVKLYEDRHPKKIIGKNADRGLLYLETASGPPEPVRHDDVELWPWEIEQTEKVSKSCDNCKYCIRPGYKSPCLECVDCEDEAYKYWELDQKGRNE